MVKSLSWKNVPVVQRIGGDQQNIAGTHFKTGVADKNLAAPGLDNNYFELSVIVQKDKGGGLFHKRRSQGKGRDRKGVISDLKAVVKHWRSLLWKTIHVNHVLKIDKIMIEMTSFL